jgi:hypothetical protein
MIWRGQYLAILAVITLVSIGISAYKGSPAIAFLTIIVVIFLRIGIGIIDLIFKAFTGKPLIYDVKILDD